MAIMHTLHSRLISGDAKHLVSAVDLLSDAVVASTHNHQLTLLLVKIYILLGASLFCIIVPSLG